MGSGILRFTPIYASILGFVILFLAYRVVAYRRSEGVSLGDDKGSKEMKRAVRAHANAIENVPLGLMLLLMLELNHLTPWLLNLLGAAFVVSRVLHAWGLSHKTGPSFGRFYGTLVCWICLALMAVLNILIIVTR